MNPLIIKKYQNSKLFNTEKHCYMSLNEVNDLMLKNSSFLVICNKSKKDITTWICNECKIRFQNLQVS